MSKNKSPKYSLVFLTWNAENEIEETLSAAFDQKFDDYEVVVVDNNSTDDTIPIVKDRYSHKDKIKIIENGENLGFSQGINQGIKRAEGRYIGCYNDDTILEKKYLLTLNKHVTEDTVWTTARLNHRSSKEKKCVRLMTKTGFTIPYSVDQLDGVYSVNFVPGDGVIIPRKIYEESLKNRVFDDTLPIRGEDIGLSLQCRAKGIPMCAIMDTHSTHPDKLDRYNFTLSNMVEFFATYRARLLANLKYNKSIDDSLFVIFSIITQPIAVYHEPYPRSASEFILRREKIS